MSPAINSKLPHVGITVFTVMSALAAEYKAINLGQGFPDFTMNSELYALVNKAMQDGHNQYVHTYGLGSLRERISEKIKKSYSAKIDPDKEITITPGGTYAIYTALTTVLRAGDEVIVFEPMYDSYIPNIEISGAIAVSVPLQFPDFWIDWKLVKEKISAKTKMIILNSPHNPTGMVLDRNDIEQLRSIVKDTGIFILSDEVYEHVIFDDKEHESILRYPDLFERSFVCFSFGKTYHCTGWKMGYCIAPPLLMQEFRKVHQFNAFSCFGPVQFALAEFMKREDEYLQLAKFIQQKRDHFQELMKQTRFKAIPSFGSYFQLYSYADISNEKEKDYAVRLVKEYGVATIPLAAFYQKETNNQLLRFCFTKKAETLEDAANRLMKIRE